MRIKKYFTRVKENIIYEIYNNFFFFKKKRRRLTKSVGGNQHELNLLTFVNAAGKEKDILRKKAFFPIALKKIS